MIENEYTPKPEVEVPRNSYPILNNVTNIQGRHIGKNIIEDILQNQVSLIDIFGPPISGKSTFLNGISQAVRENSSRMGQDMQIINVFYEDVLESFQKENPIQDSNPQLSIEGSEFNDRFCDEVDATIQKAKDSGKQTLILVENPGVGKTDIKDRCVTANDYILRKYIAQGIYGVNAKAFVLLPEKGLERRGALIRTMLTKNDELTGKPFLSDNEIQEYLARQGIILQTNTNLPVLEMGKKVRRIIQKTATEEQTDNIFNEEVELLKDFQSRLTPEDHSRIAKIIVPSYRSSAELLTSTSADGQKFEGYDEFVNKRARIIEDYEKKWAYFYQQRMEQRGIPPDKGIVLFNPYLENTNFYLRV